jgi:hypothetical protein
METISISITGSELAELEQLAEWLGPTVYMGTVAEMALLLGIHQLKFETAKATIDWLRAEMNARFRQ